MTIDGFIEQITHSGSDSGTWLTDLQVSPIPAVPYSVFTSLRTTLFSGSSSGSHTITIAALPDAATNVLRSELTAGQALTVGTGATAEIVTIATGGVPSTSLGYTSAVLTLTAGLANTHSSGETVIEVPDVIDDVLGTFDAVQFAF